MSARELPPIEGELAEVAAEAATGEIVYLTRDGKPVAAVVPLRVAAAAEARKAEEDALLAEIIERSGKPTLDHYRHVYASAGLEWPGEEEIRRLYPVAS